MTSHHIYNYVPLRVHVPKVEGVGYVYSSTTTVSKNLSKGTSGWGNVIYFFLFETLKKNMSKSSDFERLDDFLKKDMWSGLRSLRRYFLKYEKRWLYNNFVRINLKPTTFDTLMSYVVSTNWMSDLLVLNLTFIFGSFYYYSMYHFGRIIFNLYLSLLLHSFGFFPAELPPNRLDQRLIPRARSLLGGYACQDTWILTTCVSSIIHAMVDDDNIDVTTPTNLLSIVGLVMYVCFFGYSRVWAIARFHHTVVMGVLGAGFGNLCYYLFYTYFKTYSRKITIFMVTGASLVLFLWWMLNIESNNANGFGIPKQEYMRVLGDIMNNDATVTMGGGDDRYQQIASQRARQAVLRQRREINKKDGFVQMLERIEKRNVERLRVGERTPIL